MEKLRAAPLRSSKLRLSHSTQLLFRFHEIEEQALDPTPAVCQRVLTWLSLDIPDQLCHLLSKFPFSLQPLETCKSALVVAPTHNVFKGTIQILVSTYTHVSFCIEVASEFMIRVPHVGESTLSWIMIELLSLHELKPGRRQPKLVETLLHLPFLFFLLPLP